MDFRLTLLLVALSYGGVVASTNNKTIITIYFESLCPDSQKFFIKEFRSGYNALKDDINFKLVPAGHSNETNCQHGVPECEGNKILACGINLINDIEVLVNFTECIMKNNTSKSDVHFNYAGCNSTTKNFENIINCSTSQTGDNYFSNFRNLTQTTFPDDKFDVPFITVDEVVNATISNTLRKDFLKNVCLGPLKDKNLHGCHPSSSSTLVASVISTFLAVVMARL